MARPSRKVFNIADKTIEPVTRARAIYIGRTTAWGNPYPITDYITRENAIEMFRQWANHKIKIDKDWLLPLHNKDLLCHCKPLSCHGDILLIMARQDYLKTKQ